MQDFGKDSSRESPERNSFVSLKQGESIGALCHAMGTKEDAAGARSSGSMINGATGDTGDRRRSGLHV